MTKEERAKVCNILGLSKALQILSSKDKNVANTCKEIDKIIEELIVSPEEKEVIVEKKIIEHHYDRGPYWYPVYYETLPKTWDKWTITCNGSDSNTAAVSSGESLTISASNVLL